MAAVALWMPPGTEPDGERIVAVLRGTVPAEQHADTFAVLEQMDRLHSTATHGDARPPHGAVVRTARLRSGRHRTGRSVPTDHEHAAGSSLTMEPAGIEPATSCLQSRR